ncbi:hypothetical protein ACJX0J_012010 [Zea mays]
MVDKLGVSLASLIDITSHYKPLGRVFGFILLNLTPTCIQNNSRLFRKKRKNKKKRKAKESLHPKLRSSVQPLYDRTQSKLGVLKNFIVLIIVLINSIIIQMYSNVMRKKLELTIK